jgi:hypothetical protein
VQAKCASMKARGIAFASEAIAQIQEKLITEADLF